MCGREGGHEAGELCGTELAVAEAQGYSCTAAVRSFTKKWRTSGHRGQVCVIATLRDQNT